MIAAHVTQTVADLTWLDVAYAALAVLLFLAVLLVLTGIWENRKDEALGLRERVPWFWNRRR